MKKSSSGFTLVELLVVITIIAILAGVALPVFQKALETAKVTKDANNLRQIGLGVSSYKTDNNGDILDSTKSYLASLYPTYISTYKIFISPFDNNPTSETASAEISYAINGVTGTNGTMLGVDSSKLNYPSNVIMFAPRVDTATVSGSSLKFTALLASGVTSTTVVSTPGSATPKKGTQRNFTLLNVLYADGHTEQLLFSKFADKTSSDGKKLWVYDTP